MVGAWVGGGLHLLPKTQLKLGCHEEGAGDAGVGEEVEAKRRWGGACFPT